MHPARFVGVGQTAAERFRNEVCPGRGFSVRSFPSFLTLSFISQQSKRLDRTIALTWTFRQSLDSLQLLRLTDAFGRTVADGPPRTEQS